MSAQAISFDYSKYNFRDEVQPVYSTKPGLSEEVVDEISRLKDEPEWMRRRRLEAYRIFLQKPMPTWGADLSSLDFQKMRYYVRPTEGKYRSWEEVPEYIKRTFERLGIPEAERKFLAGVGAQYDSEVVYHNVRRELEKLGVIFCDMDTAVREYPEIVRRYFGTVVPADDNKFAALNTAVWSGGSFVYVPEGVEVEFPLQAYFRINAANMGQFERTLIIAEPYSKVHYIEGCLPGDELVLKGDTVKPISELMPGEIVLNGAGEETVVRAVRIRDYEGELVEIVPLSPGNAFRLTPDHPVLVVRREQVAVRRRRRYRLVETDSKKFEGVRPEYVPAGELREGDFLVYPVNREVEDDPRFTEDVLKLLGYYLAEGSAFIHKSLGVPVVEFSLGADEQDIVEEIAALIEKISGKRPSVISYRERKAVTVVTYSKTVYDLCVNECPGHSHDRALSRRIMRLPPEKQKVLLEAYLKGDGSVYVKGRKLVRASTASKTLAFQLQEMLARLGIFASIMVRKGGEDRIGGRRIVRRDQYVIAFSPNKRWSEVRLVDGFFYVPIRKVRRVKFAGKVYNLEVLGPHDSYLARGFVVHNCTAPIYSTESLHAAVVEVIAMKGAHVRYTTLQNWSTDVYNLVTKRSFAYEGATVEWVDANIGSKVTMKYPSVYLLGRGARAEILSVAFAGRGQHQDTGAKAVHLAPDTTSRITSKSVCKDGGRVTYRGLLHVAKGAKRVKSSVRCDSLILDDRSRTDTYPYNEIQEDDATVTHEATVGRIGEDQLFYLMSRGIPEQEALNMIVLGFFEGFTKTLPMEYAIEFNRLIELEMSGSVG